MFNVTDKVIFDNRVARREVRSYHPYAGTKYENNDEIRVPVHNQEHIFLPSEADVHIEGEIVRSSADNTPSATAVPDQNFAANLFDEMRIELNGKEIERTRRVGTTSAIKTFASYSKNEMLALQNAGYFLSISTPPNEANIAHATTKLFHAIIPLSLLCGLFEDYRKPFINCKLEFIFIRSRDDKCALFSANAEDTAKVKVRKMYIKLPTLILSDEEEVKRIKLIQKNPSIPVAFRSWSYHELPTIPNSTKINWTVMTTSQIEKPRVFMLAFQTDRKKINVSSSLFDHCNIRSVGVFLNSNFYPYEKAVANFNNGDYSELYDMFIKFRNAYYQLDDNRSEPNISRSEFHSHCPIVVVNCMEQVESIKSSSVDVRVEIETNEPIPANTTLHCIIIHDRIINYKPLTNEVFFFQ
ncbi:uncharacterized protein [Anabrus simplex]|uniref:uncharacterized protein n=1 Tax=Anabrus simplex TaxID=316456 RepID=UPI0035A27835